jgi:hypothetical protein
MGHVHSPANSREANRRKTIDLEYLWAATSYQKYSYL